MHLEKNARAAGARFLTAYMNKQACVTLADKQNALVQLQLS